MIPTLIMDTICWGKKQYPYGCPAHAPPQRHQPGGDRQHEEQMAGTALN